jgi:hypothetical protein
MGKTASPLLFSEGIVRIYETARPPHEGVDCWVSRAIWVRGGSAPCISISHTAIILLRTSLKAGNIFIVLSLCIVACEKALLRRAPVMPMGARMSPIPTRNLMCATRSRSFQDKETLRGKESNERKRRILRRSTPVLAKCKDGGRREARHQSAKRGKIPANAILSPSRIPIPKSNAAAAPGVQPHAVIFDPSIISGAFAGVGTGPSILNRSRE